MEARGKPRGADVPSSTKERILDVTADMFRHYGYTGTGLKQIVTNANAPFGSVYHFFPGGKEELGVAVIRRSGRMYYELFETILDGAPDPVAGIADFFAGAAEVLRQTDFADACPIATVALEVANRNEPLRQATAEVFESWVVGAAARLTAAGIPADRARTVATLVISTLEGAFVLSRASRTTEAVDVAGEAAAAAVRAALPHRTRPARRGHHSVEHRARSTPGRAVPEGSGRPIGLKTPWPGPVVCCSSRGASAPGRSTPRCSAPPVHSLPRRRRGALRRARPPPTLQSRRGRGPARCAGGRPAGADPSS